MNNYADEQREERETERYINRYATRAQREHGDVLLEIANSQEEKP